MTTYFGASVVLGKTRNLAAFHSGVIGAAKNAFYSAYKGITPGVKLLSRKGIINENRVVFLNYVSQESYEHEGRPAMGRACKEMADALSAGQLSFPLEMTMQELEAKAGQRAAGYAVMR